MILFLIKKRIWNPAKYLSWSFLQKYLKEAPSFMCDIVLNTSILIIYYFLGNTITNILMCFSLLKNTRAIFSTKVPKGAITSINGIRTISMTWVILGHLYFYSTLPPNTIGKWSYHILFHSL